MALVERRIILHGHDVRFREYRPHAPVGAAPDADVIVLVHGIAGSGETWLPLLRELDRRRFPRVVIAVDLLGHGESAKPRGDYSLGAFASGIRDVLVAEGHRTATLIGHSLGGGIALQFAYQFPEFTSRLVLVDSGGFGRDVSFILRAVALPGASVAMALGLNKVTSGVVDGIGRLAGRFGGALSAEGREMARHLWSLADGDRRTAFLHTVRGVIDLRGQRATAVDRLYLAELVPTMVVWGTRDRMIPPAHAKLAAELMPRSRLELFEESGHFPHAGQARRFADVLTDFLATTKPARVTYAEMRALIGETEPVEASVS